MLPSRVGILLVLVLWAASVPFLKAADQEAAGLTYRKHGLDWPGLCQSGKKQSPIPLKTEDLKPYDHAEFSPKIETLGTVEGILIFLTPVLPHVELEWEHVVKPMKATLAATKDGDIFAPLRGDADPNDIKRVAFEPVQFHFHTPSESSLDGKLFDGVIHIVSFVKDGESEMCDAIKADGGLGCPVVISIFLNGDDGAQTGPIDAVFTRHVKSTGDPSQGGVLHAASDFGDNDYLIRSAGKENGVRFDGPFDLDVLLPNDGSIATWEGSLTTAPCTEGVFWIKFLSPMTIPQQQIRHLRQTIVNAVAPDCEKTVDGKCFPSRHPSNNRVLQSLNDRVVWKGHAF